MAVILRQIANIPAPTFTEADGSFLEFDAIVNERNRDTADATEHPVEKGADITDHVQEKPRELALTVLASNSPIDESKDQEDRDIVIWQALRSMFKRKDVITVVTGLETYENMIILSVETGRDGGQGQILPLAVALKEIFFANQEIVNVPASVLQDRAKRSGQSKKDAGRQGHEDLGELTPEEQAAAATTVATGAAGAAEYGGAGSSAPGVEATSAPPAPEKEKAEKEKSKLKAMVDSAGT